MVVYIDDETTLADGLARTVDFNQKDATSHSGQVSGHFTISGTSSIVPISLATQTSGRTLVPIWCKTTAELRVNISRISKILYASLPLQSGLYITSITLNKPLRFFILEVAFLLFIQIIVLIIFINRPVVKVGIKTS